MSKTMFIGPDGNPVSLEEFIGLLFNTLTLPEYFSSEEQLRMIWADPTTRKALLGRLSEAGFPETDLLEIQKLITAEDSDLIDVLEWVAYATPPISREERATSTRPQLQAALSPQQTEFIEFVLARYVASGVDELDTDRLPALLELKYDALQDGIAALGGAEEAKETFLGFQRQLYRAG